MVEGKSDSMYFQKIISTTNNYSPMEERYSGLICQHALSNILNVYQIFIKLLQQPTKPHGLVGQFSNRKKVNKKSYDYIDAFLRRSKYDIGETIATRYGR